jgi:phosphoribosylaminoimidazole-succinocarboxamide synthase
MPEIQSVLATTDDIPIRTDLSVHSGKVRSVYWLTEEDSRRLISEHSYPVPAQTELAVMVVSDRMSAFDCLWRGENNLYGVPGKGAAINAISHHWFQEFKSQGLADNHIVDAPHPLVWIVQKARPVKVEAIARAYITGSMWRAYERGEREFCGQRLHDDLTQHQRLDELLVTPSTKGVLSGIPGVPEAEDVNISRSIIENNFEKFGFNTLSDIALYESLLRDGFTLISEKLASIGQIFVDTKFEFGYVQDENGVDKLIYMDEVGTPDSSRFWDAEAYSNGRVTENSKEAFRQVLLNYFSEPDILLNKNRMQERQTLAENTELPLDILLEISSIYQGIAEQITGEQLVIPADPKQEIISILDQRYGIIDHRLRN